jgi:hypothetical protein
MGEADVEIIVQGAKEKYLDATSTCFRAPTSQVHHYRGSGGNGRLRNPTYPRLTSEVARPAVGVYRRQSKLTFGVSDLGLDETESTLISPELQWRVEASNRLRRIFNQYSTSTTSCRRSMR